ncbi:MAG: hypothetical protein ACREMZ_10175 [Gemmatimonadales bacterium]
MGANLLIVVATAAFQYSPQDTITSTAHGIGFERLSDIFQYNRVQGLSLGLGYRIGLAGSGFGVGYVTVRYGLSDDRLTGRLSFLRDVMGGRVALSGYSDIEDLDPFSPGRTLSNTFNGIFAGHDNGDYAMARGGSASFETAVGAGLQLLVGTGIERQSSIRRVAESEVNDFLGGSGVFPPNPPVEEGTFGAASVKLSHVIGTRWNLAADVLGGSGRTTARLWGDLRRDVGSGPGITLRLKAGAATARALPQNLFRLGGLNTVRGFEYGVRRGPAFWAAQVDISLFAGRVRPVLFVDAGQAAEVGELLSSRALAGGGVSLSLFSGLIRFDLSRPISPDQGGKLRFDLVMRGVR